MLWSKMEYYLPFTRLATVWLCFFGRASEFSCAFHFPILPKSGTYGCPLSKPCQTKAWGQGEQSASVCLIATLKCQTWAYCSWVSIYILHSTLCTLCFKASASGSLIPTTFCFHCLLVCPSATLLRVCGESPGIRWTRRSTQRDGLFSALNEIWQLEYAIHDFNLSSKLEG